MPNKFENVPHQVNEKLLPEEAQEIVVRINDSRISIDPANHEYFLIKLPEGTRYIPRLKNIPQVKKDGSVSYIHVEDFLRQTLTSLDNPDK